jgi:hypothetical protein
MDLVERIEEVVDGIRYDTGIQAMVVELNVEVEKAKTNSPGPWAP